MKEKEREREIQLSVNRVKTNDNWDIRKRCIIEMKTDWMKRSIKLC